MPILHCKKVLSFFSVVLSTAKLFAQLRMTLEALKINWRWNVARRENWRTYGIAMYITTAGQAISGGSALLLPKNQAIYQHVSSSIVDMVKLEADIHARNAFHGYLEFSETQAGVTRAWRLFFLNSRRVSVTWLDTDFQASNFQLGDHVGSFGLFELEYGLAYVLAALEHGNAVVLDAAFNLGMREVLTRCLEAKANGVMRLQKPDGATADLVLGFGKILFAYSSMVDSNLVVSGFVNTLGPNQPIKASLVLSHPLAQPLDLAPRIASSATVLEAWSVLLQRTQNLLDRNAPGQFNRIWRQSGLQLADEYPALDPFMNDLVWNGSILEWKGDETENLIPALVAGYTTSLRGANFSSEVLFNPVGAEELIGRYQTCGIDQVFGNRS
jgi:hypothetical protein